MPAFIPKIWRSTNLYKNIKYEYQTVIITLDSSGTSDYIIQTTTQTDDDSWETATEGVLHTFTNSGSLIRVQVIGREGLILTGIHITATGIAI